jgi:hypothetical protein
VEQERCFVAMVQAGRNSGARMTERDVMHVNAAPGKRVIVFNAVTSDPVGWIDVPVIPALPEPPSGERPKANGVALERCHCCVLCGTGRKA